MKIFTYTALPGGASGGSFSFGSGSSSGGVDVSRNPFLNGQFAAGVSTSSASKPGKSVVTSVTAAQIDAREGFLGVQPAQPFGGKKSSSIYTEQSVNQGAQPFAGFGLKKQFAASFPSQAFAGASAGGFGAAGGAAEGQGGRSSGVACQGQGYICVERAQCVNGVAGAAAAVYQASNKVSLFNSRRCDNFLNLKGT